MSISLNTFVHTATQHSHVKLDNQGELQSQSRLGALWGRVTSWLPGRSDAQINQSAKNSFKASLTQQFGSQIANQVLQQNGLHTGDHKPLRSRDVRQAVRQAIVLQAQQPNASTQSLPQQAIAAQKAMLQANRNVGLAMNAHRQTFKVWFQMSTSPSKFSPAQIQQARQNNDNARLAKDQALGQLHQATHNATQIHTLTGLLPQLFKAEGVAVPLHAQDIVQFDANVQAVRDTAIQTALRESGLM